MDEYKIEFEEFDKTKLKGTYTRLHYGTLKISKLKFPFVVYEAYLSEFDYYNFSLNYPDGKPEKSNDFTIKIIQQVKNKLKL